MHEIDNDCVHVNYFEEMVPCSEEVSRRINDGHSGIGPDGLVLIKPSEVADCRMQMFNADGSRRAMYGNAIRRVGKYMHEHGIVKKTSISMGMKSGLCFLELDVRGSEVVSVTMDMRGSELTSKPPEPIAVDGVDREFISASVGNLHAVYFMEEIDELDLERIGPAFEHHARFSERTNTKFIQLVDRSHIRMRVQERGSGETWVCRTGASTGIAAPILMGYMDREVEVFLRGGKLVIRWDEESSRIFMTGLVVEVFHGEIEIRG